MSDDQDEEVTEIQQLSFFQGKLIEVIESDKKTKAATKSVKAESRQAKSRAPLEEIMSAVKEEITAVIALNSQEAEPRRTKIMNITEPELKIDFEASLAELENVVRELDGEVKLEKALQLFEQGIKLSVECEQFIKGAEAKIEILKKQADGSITTEAFQGERVDLDD